MAIRQSEGPGKFEGEILLTELFWQLTLESSQDDEAGSVPELGWWAALFRFDRPDQDIEALNRAALGEGPLTEEEEELIRTHAGVIIFTGDAGFVSATYYGSREELEKAWRELKEEEARFFKEAEEEGFQL